MTKNIITALFALLLTGCISQPQTLSELKSEFVTVDDSIKVHYKYFPRSDAYIYKV